MQKDCQVVEIHLPLKNILELKSSDRITKNKPTNPPAKQKIGNLLKDMSISLDLQIAFKTENSNDFPVWKRFFPPKNPPFLLTLNIDFPLHLNAIYFSSLHYLSFCSDVFQKVLMFSHQHPNCAVLILSIQFSVLKHLICNNSHRENYF